MTDLDDQFNLRKRHPQGAFHMLISEWQSALVRMRYTHAAGVKYGKSDGEGLDIFPSPIPHSPVLVFIHGGYFRAQDKKQYS